MKLIKIDIHLLPTPLDEICDDNWVMEHHLVTDASGLNLEDQIAKLVNKVTEDVHTNDEEVISYRKAVISEQVSVAISG